MPASVLMLGCRAFGAGLGATDRGASLKGKCDEATSWQLCARRWRKLGWGPPHARHPQFFRATHNGVAVNLTAPNFNENRGDPAMTKAAHQRGSARSELRGSTLAADRSGNADAAETSVSLVSFTYE